MNRNALIWGADGGIGRALASHLLEQGWTVVLTGRNLERMQNLAGVMVEADVSDPFSVQSAVSAISQEVDEVRLWIYAVGDIVSSPVSQMSIQVWRRILDANLTGAFLTTHYSLPLLAQDAHLFYLGARSERLRLPGLAAYVAAKGGLESFIEVVRKETRRKVTLVRPAAVDTPLWNKTPFKIPPHPLSPADLASRILQAYQEGTSGLLDI